MTSTLTGRGRARSMHLPEGQVGVEVEGEGEADDGVSQLSVVCEGVPEVVSNDYTATIGDVQPASTEAGEGVVRTAAQDILRILDADAATIFVTVLKEGVAACCVAGCWLLVACCFFILVAADCVLLLLAWISELIIGLSTKLKLKPGISSGATITVLAQSQLPLCASAHESDRVVQVRIFYFFIFFQAMFEGLVRQLLVGYLGQYMKDIEKEQLRISLWNGNQFYFNIFAYFSSCVPFIFSLCFI
ncbi:hypothetical protein CsSME_00028684 [Camellia sinensis var. sinensis]